MARQSSAHSLLIVPTLMKIRSATLTGSLAFGCFPKTRFLNWALSDLFLIRVLCKHPSSVSVRYITTE